MKDIVIIGAGIIGSFLAYDLSKYDLNLAVLDQNSDVACGATKANSAIVHSGHDPKEGTLKALLFCSSFPPLMRNQRDRGPAMPPPPGTPPRPEPCPFPGLLCPAAS